MQDQSAGVTERVRFEIPDLTVVRDIGMALEKKDDDLLWAVAGRAPSQELFYEQLRNQVGYTSYVTGADASKRTRQAENRCALVMVPLVLSARAAKALLRPQACDDVMPEIRAWLQEWFKFQVRITLFNCLFTYSEVCMWSPTITRTRLEQLVSSAREGGPLAVSAQDLCVPDDAPVLAFIVAAAHAKYEWPALPPLSPLEDLKLQARISGVLQLRTESLREAIEVVTPAFASEAISAGLTEWLTRLGQQHGLRRWDVRQADQDVVILHLEVGDDAPQTSVVPLRAHQLGLDGVEECVKHVVALGAACFGTPQ